MRSSVSAKLGGRTSTEIRIGYGYRDEYAVERGPRFGKSNQPFWDRLGYLGTGIALLIVHTTFQSPAAFGTRRIKTKWCYSLIIVINLPDRKTDNHFSSMWQNIFFSVSLSFRGVLGFNMATRGNDLQSSLAILCTPRVNKRADSSERWRCSTIHCCTIYPCPVFGRAAVHAIRFPFITEVDLHL